MKQIDSIGRKHHVSSTPEAAKEKGPAHSEREEGDQASEAACRTNNPFVKGQITAPVVRCAGAAAVRSCVGVVGPTRG
jgi:hypothetical protein